MSCEVIVFEITAHNVRVALAYGGSLAVRIALLLIRNRNI